MVYLTKGVHGTTAIEGNALTEQEVRDRIENSVELPKSKEYMQQEIDNIVTACNLIKDNLVNKSWDTSLTVERIKQFHALILDKLPLDERIKPGELRTYPVSVYDYFAPDSKYCDELLRRLCEWLNSYYPLDNGEHPIANAIVKAIICHIYIAWIHPFGDGNGRTVRLLELNLLVASGVPAIAAHLLSNHYNLTRSEYLRELRESSRSGGDIVPFLKVCNSRHAGWTERTVQEDRTVPGPNNVARLCLFSVSQRDRRNC